jgi:hypothetical protein
MDEVVEMAVVVTRVDEQIQKVLDEVLVQQITNNSTSRIRILQRQVKEVDRTVVVLDEADIKIDYLSCRRRRI